MNRPAFIITIDTEGDNLWSRPKQVQTENARFLQRFQDLCEKFCFPPTYLTNREMAINPIFVAMAKNAIDSRTAEVGMHLHPWDSPPIHSITKDDSAHHPFLIDYPVDLMAAKIDYITKLLEDTFHVKMSSHRAGRWAFNETYARLLVERGYQTDCSVTPGHSWSKASGAPGRFGADYTNFPNEPYFLDLEDISRPGDSLLLEVPMTIHRSVLKQRLPSIYEVPIVSRLVNRVAPPLNWLRPTGRNLQSMLAIVENAELQNAPYIEFMIHSSEFMVGGSPYFPDQSSIDRLYSDIEVLFKRISRRFVGMTLSGFRQSWQLSI